ncbi:electron transfer flavo protein, alpha subunit [Fistulina hepatica ATCC 64428]|uniref:Probable electron transfer flavoprotein subunit alpha n=1 Tax=Fistulina hepatica ATCC 64428 TaxID=1128425 RepID=A0A0D7A3D5_9AGAR|nr:electron transfer flavo protein, alpha subunit [Fistulina hepatica ATCC 64428]
MLGLRSVAVRRALSRSYASAAAPHALVFLEHTRGVIEPSSLSALSAAQKLGGQVTGLVVGAPGDVEKAVGQAKKLPGLTSVWHASSSQYANIVPEVVSPLLGKLLSDAHPSFTHVVSAHSASARSILPRVAAQLDAPAISDITSLEHNAEANSTTFERPIYAGNAVATVRAPASVPLKFFTVRPTAFTAAAPDEGYEAAVQAVDPVEVTDSPAQHVQYNLTKSDRPDLATASRVVSGGRALKNAETFAATMYPLADVLGAAVGASRAAVDAGYADNSLQVGQTGKVVAPELYMAVGISGAIQHLAGMKDSKLIVAINKDPDAPIFQVADAGLVADLYQAVPELIEKLKK